MCSSKDLDLEPIFSSVSDLFVSPFAWGSKSLKNFE